MRNIIIFSFVVLSFIIPGFMFASHGPPMTVTTISPSSGSPGDTVVVTITGSNFLIGSGVTVILPTCGGFCGISQTASPAVTVHTTATVTLRISGTAPFNSAGYVVEVNSGGHPALLSPVPFRVVPPGSSGTTGGGGFVEDVPTRFGPIPEGPQTGGEFISTIEGITNWVFVILLVFAVIFILLAAFQFIAGGGEPQAVAQARSKLIWAAVGIAVALLARGIPAAIGNLFL